MGVEVQGTIQPRNFPQYLHGIRARLLLLIQATRATTAAPTLAFVVNNTGHIVVT
jgi:hypothetical protein